MKKWLKLTIIGLIVLSAVAGTIYYMMMPVSVRMTPVVAGVAELTFMEQGIVTAENTVLVFPVIQGELNGLYVREGQEVSLGDVLISVDDTNLRLQLEQVKSGIMSLEAQLANVGVEDALMRQNLQSTRGSLQCELQRINAQASETDRLAVREEQIRIQQVLIDQHQNELNRVQGNFSRIQTLHNSGVATLSELESASSSLRAAESQLEAAEGQMAIIVAGVPETSPEVFAGMRTSINAQIAGINQQLAQDTTTAARAHFEAMIDVEQANVARLERDIENTSITAPTSGIVTTLHAQNTNFITSTAPVAEITTPGNLTIDVYVSTQDITSISIGDTVGLVLRRRLEDVEFYGVVTAIDSTAVVRLSALGVEERKINIQIEPHLPVGTELGIGHAVDVVFFIFREEDRITVPRTAVFTVNGQDIVWAVRNGTVNAVPVETGLTVRTDIIIESGLSGVDFVVNDANNPDLRDGARVVDER